jgi:hypothetical protein
LGKFLFGEFSVLVGVRFFESDTELFLYAGRHCCWVASTLASFCLSWPLSLSTATTHHLDSGFYEFI